MEDDTGEEEEVDREGLAREGLKVEEERLEEDDFLALTTEGVVVAEEVEDFLEEAFILICFLSHAIKAKPSRPMILTGISEFRKFDLLNIVILCIR